MSRTKLDANQINDTSGDISGPLDTVSVDKVKGVAVSGTAPTTGQVLTATSATTADWGTPSSGASPSGVNGDLQVKNGASFGTANDFITGAIFRFQSSNNTFLMSGPPTAGFINIYNGQGSLALNTTTTGFTEGSVSLDTDNVARIYIRGSAGLGRVGVHTSSPSHPFHVVGSVRIDDGTQIAGYVFTTDSSGVGSWQPASGGVLGTGTTNKYTKWTSSTTIGNALISDDGSNIVITTGNPILISAAGASPAAIAPAPIIQITGDGNTSGFASVTYGSGQNGIFAAAHATGTLASPTAIPFTEGILDVAALGYDGTGFNSGGEMGFSANELWTPTAHGTIFHVNLVATGTTTTKQVIAALGDNGGQVYIGRSNTASPADGPYTLSVEQSMAIVGSNPEADLLRLIGYGTNPSYVAYSAQGTESSPTATQSGDNILFVGAKGFDGTNFSLTGSRAGILMDAVESFTPTAQGTRMRLRVTAPGTTANTNVVFINAPSTGTGYVGINNNAASHALDVTGDANITGNYKVGGSNLQSGTSGQLAVFNGSQTETSYSNLAWDNTNTSLLIGGFPSNTPFALPQIEVVGSGGAPAAHVATVFGSSGGDPIFIGARAGGTQASPTATPSGKSLIQFAAVGHSGTAFDFSNNGGTLDFHANELWSPSAHGTDCQIKLTPSGSTSATTIIYFSANGGGRAGFGGNNSPAYAVDATGDANVSGVYRVGGVSGFTGTGAYTNFTIVGGIITAAS